MTVYTNGPCIGADYAIVTFSLGVLQHDVVKFVPELPDWKKAAIASFEIGTYTKIFLQFDEPFWPEDTQFLIWADPHERGHYPQFQPLDLPEALPGSGVLVATVVNNQAYKVEAQTDEETQAEVMKILRQMFGQNISDPIAIYYPRWTQEPWYVHAPLFPVSNPQLIQSSGHSAHSPTGRPRPALNSTKISEPTSGDSTLLERRPVRSSSDTCMVPCSRATSRVAILRRVSRERPRASTEGMIRVFLCLLGYLCMTCTMREMGGL